MRRPSLRIALLALCGIAAAAAQAPAPAHKLHGPPPVARAVEHALGLDQHPAPAAANAKSTPQVVLDATHLGSPITLEKGWRVGITASEKAADASFDDSTWAVRDADATMADVPDEDHVAGTPQSEWARDGSYVGPPKDQQGGVPHQRPWVWFRQHIKLAPGHGPVALLMELPVSQTTTVSLSNAGPFIDVYANGKAIAPEGPHSDEPEHYQQITRVYPLNVPPEQTDLVLVLRTIYIGVGYGAYTGFFADRKLTLGYPNDLSSRLQIWSTDALLQRLPRLVNSVLLVVLALFLLALYLTQKGHREYLLLALHELLLAPLAFVELFGGTAQIDTLVYVATVMQLVMISSYLYFEFLVSFLELKKRWYIRALRYTSPVLAGVGPVLLLVGKSELAGVLLLVIWALAFLWFVGWLVFIFATLIRATLRRNFEAGLLLIPLILDMVGIVEPMLTGGMSQITGHAYRSPLTLQAGPIPIHFASFADFAGILSIVIIIFRRFLRIQHDQERANSELAAARSVQELMIPREKIETPGFEVDSVYEPATEVGGDFFYVEPGSDGSLLLVVGDVAGHGLKAAMNVSMLVGALRRNPERRPAKILEALNRVVVPGSESYTTCQALWFGPRGELAIANAGHLPPYLNSQEVRIPGGLPLGALPETTYDEVRLYLHPGDRLLLLSDGVTEARNATGELFGFDRVHNLSNQSAFYIADAAKEFGQDDDITVLTVRRVVESAA